MSKRLDSTLPIMLQTTSQVTHKRIVSFCLELKKLFMEKHLGGAVGEATKMLEYTSLRGEVLLLVVKYFM